MSFKIDPDHIASMGGYCLSVGIYNVCRNVRYIPFIDLFLYCVMSWANYGSIQVGGRSLAPDAWLRHIYKCKRIIPMICFW